MKIYTIGHTTRSIEEFVNTLAHYHIEIVVDIRRNPKSKHNKDFEGLNLEISLEKKEISYIHIPQLGSIYFSKESEDASLRNTPLRGYREYMKSNEFDLGFSMLNKIASDHVTAIMCYEALPDKCPRILISRNLVDEEFSIEHIIANKV